MFGGFQVTTCATIQSASCRVSTEAAIYRSSNAMANNSAKMVLTKWAVSSRNVQANILNYSETGARSNVLSFGFLFSNTLIYIYNYSRAIFLFGIFLNLGSASILPLSTFPSIVPLNYVLLSQPCMFE